MKFGAIAIGRNEGVRLRRCLMSLSTAASVVYVDSGSTDGSAQWARDHGVCVIELDMNIPFTAARARNVGFKRLQEMAPDLFYVQFVDGDCELSEGWSEHAISFLESHSDVAAVCGRLRERHPDQTIYNWLCDKEWDRPPGEVSACGGIAMMRAATFAAVGGYRDNIIAGEEPELCFRLRAAGFHIWRLNNDMALHDAAMTHFSQWWRRGIRAGYAFAQGVYLHGASPERYYVWESRRAWFFGILLPITLLISGLVFGPWGWAAWLIYPLHVLQKIVRFSGPLGDRALLALFDVLGHFPQAYGQIKFFCDRMLGREASIIEYK